MRLPLRTLTLLGAGLPALALPSLAQAQNYSDLPPLTRMSETELRTLPPEYRTAPAHATPAFTQTSETVTTVDGVETITRTRRIDAPRPAPAGPATYAPQQPAYAPHFPPVPFMPVAAPVMFERGQWIEECRRRTRGQGRNNTGLIIGGLLGAIGGGFAGYEIANAGDRVLGTVLGVGGGGLIGSFLGSLFDRKDRRRYDCEAALDSYLTQYGSPNTRIASREIGYPAYSYGYPASFGYSYAPPQQMVVVPVRSEMQQQVVVRETVREERYTVPGAVRDIPAPRPSPKMIKADRR